MAIFARGAILGAVVLALARAHLPPGLATAWSARVKCSSYFHSEWFMDLGTSSGPRYLQLDSTPSILLGESHWFNWSVYGVDPQNPFHTDIVYPDGDAVCAPNSLPVIPFINPFAMSVKNDSIVWTSNGTATIGGERCELWQAGGTTVAVAGDGSPRLLVVGIWRGLECFFSDVQVGPIAEDVFAPSQACKSYPSPPCTSAGVVNLTVYRLHSAAEPRELDYRDVADGPATPAIVCNWLETDQTQMSSWTVSADSAWGQYGRCHYNGTNYCDAHTANQVGRQVPQGSGNTTLQGQCTPNLESGSWLSFPAGGKCDPGEAVGTRGCTWSDVLLRTIHAECITTNPEFRRACTEEMGHGVSNPKSTAIILAAFASDDPSKGGCPDVEQAVLIV